MSVSAPNALFEDLVEFLTSEPSLRELVDYKVPPALDERMHELLDKNSGPGLTDSERAELDEFLRWGHFLSMLALKGELKLKADER